MEQPITNFRAITIGGIAKGVLYRSEHPVPDGYENKTVVKLAKRAGINCVINLKDDSKGLQIAAEGSPWYAGLVGRGTVAALKMDFDFGASGFRAKLRKALLFMLSHDGPWLVHCYAGVDRTGIVCAILEALMGASPEEIAADYARSFYNGADSAMYTGDPKDAGRQIVSQLNAIFGADAHNGADLAALAERCLKEKLYMTGAQVAALKAKLEGKK